MQKIILNLLVVAVFGMLLPACSTKTASANADQGIEQAKKERRGQPRGGRPEFSDLLTKMDANKDGKLAQSEVDGRLKDGFSQIDTNNDGFITEDEFQNAPKPSRKGRN